MGVGTNDVSVKSHQKFHMKPLQSLFSLFADRGFAAYRSSISQQKRDCSQSRGEGGGGRGEGGGGRGEGGGGRGAPSPIGVGILVSFSGRRQVVYLEAEI